MHVYTQDFERLLGRSIVSWIGTEMAAGQDDPIVWTNASCGFLQFYDLQLCFSDDSLEHWTARLDDDCNYYGLYLEESAMPLQLFEAEGADIFRARVAPGLPTGPIVHMKKHVDEYGQVVAVTLSTADRSVTLWCGHVTWEDGQFTIRRPEEFVLVEALGEARSGRSEQDMACNPQLRSSFNPPASPVPGACI